MDDQERLDALLGRLCDIVHQRRSGDRAANDPVRRYLTHGDYAQLILSDRARVTDFLPSSLFADPALDMLLLLVARQESAAPIYAADLVRAARVSETTGRRWINTLVATGLIVLRREGRDRARAEYDLTVLARDQMLAYLEAVPPVPLTLF